MQNKEWAIRLYKKLKLVFENPVSTNNEKAVALKKMSKLKEEYNINLTEEYDLYYPFKNSKLDKRYISIFSSFLGSARRFKIFINTEGVGGLGLSCKSYEYDIVKEVFSLYSNYLSVFEGTVREKDTLAVFIIKEFRGFFDKHLYNPSLDIAGLLTYDKHNVTYLNSLDKIKIAVSANEKYTNKETFFNDESNTEGQDYIEGLLLEMDYLIDSVIGEYSEYYLVKECEPYWDINMLEKDIYNIKNRWQR